MLNAEIDLTLTFRGPFLTQSSTPTGRGLDAPFARDPSGTYFLPASHVKGHLLDAWRELGSIPGYAPRLGEWLGTSTGDSEEYTGNVEPARGTVLFSDFHFEGEDRAAGRRVRIEMNADRGVINDRMMAILESPFAPGEAVRFSGKARFVASSEAEAGEIRRHLVAGLRLITSMGAERTLGFGRLAQVSAGEASVRPVRMTGPTGPEGFAFTLTPESPFCLAGRRVSGNLFESLEVIPGGVLKGCAAALWNQLLGRPPHLPIGEGPAPAGCEALWRWFHAVRFSFALPHMSDVPARPATIPFSSLKTATGEFLNAIHQPPGMLYADCAPAFPPDWKPADWGKAAKAFGWPEVPRQLRVRTAVDDARLRAADGKLFGYSMTCPRKGEYRLSWSARADFAFVPEVARSAAAAQLRGLLSAGLHGLGKAKTYAPITLDTALPRPGMGAAHADGLYVVVLQTPAVLLNPADITVGTGSAEMTTAYQRVWSQLSGCALQMNPPFFARHSLAGGFYIHRRFQTAGQYEPFLLTEPGSVFKLRAAPGCDPGPLLRKWHDHGLDVPDWAIARYGLEDRGTAWKRCPFVPENGYGEVMVDPAWPENWGS